MRIEGMVPPVEPIKDLKLDEKPREPESIKQNSDIKYGSTPRPKDQEPGKGEIIDTYA